jgi:hypothetical protein
MEKEWNFGIFSIKWDSGFNFAGCARKIEPTIPDLLIRYYNYTIHLTKPFIPLAAHAFSRAPIAELSDDLIHQDSQ